MKAKWMMLWQRLRYAWLWTAWHLRRLLFTILAKCGVRFIDPVIPWHFDKAGDTYDFRGDFRRNKRLRRRAIEKLYGSPISGRSWRKFRKAANWRSKPGRAQHWLFSTPIAQIVRGILFRKIVRPA